MFTIKDIATRLDRHPRSAERWWRRLMVPPDLPGNPKLWEEASVNELLRRYKLFWQLRGSTPQLEREKYAGTRTDKQQLDLLSWKPKTKRCKRNSAAN